MRHALIIPERHHQDSSWSLVTMSLYLTLFFLPMKRLASLGWIGLPWEASFAKIFIALTFFLWVVASIISKDPQLFSSPYQRMIYLAIILYILASILSMFTSTVPGAAAEFIFRRIFLAILILIIVKIAKDYKTIRACILALILGSLPGALAGIYELITGKPVINITEMNKDTYRVVADLPVTATGSFRIQGLSGDSDLHGYIYIVLMGIVLITLLKSYNTGGWVKKASITILLALYIVNIFATGSRAGWIAMTICIGLFLLLSEVRKKWFILSGIALLYLSLLAGLAVFSNTPVLPRLLGLEGQSSIDSRWDEAKINLSMFHSSPILGIGTGNTPNVIYRHFKIAPSYPKLAADYKKMSTNGYLILLSENGLVGFTVYLLLLFSFITMMIRLIASTANAGDKTMALGFLSVSSAQLFLLVFYPVFDSEFWWTMIGLGIAVFNLWERKENNVTPYEGKKVPWAGTVFCPQRRSV